MVWEAVSKKGKLPLIFIVKGVKINKEYYLQHVLVENALPEIRKLYPNGNYCSQQDSAPAYKAKVAQQWCKQNCIVIIFHHFVPFIIKNKWVSYSMTPCNCVL